VAFIVSPWSCFKLLVSKRALAAAKARPAGAGSDASSAGAGDPELEGFIGRLYRRTMMPLIHNPRFRWLALGGVGLLLLGSVALVPLKLVTVKMLPFDNKSEIQVIVDAPEGMPLEETLAAAREMADRLSAEKEVRDMQVYAGASAPFNFNGLVRHYFLRSGPSVADLQVNLRPKGERKASSHAFALRVRPPLVEIAKRHGVRVKVAEIPPGRQSSPRWWRRCTGRTPGPAGTWRRRCSGCSTPPPGWWTPTGTSRRSSARSGSWWIGRRRHCRGWIRSRWG
jgi:multidrug efflux pump subunit AcrB